MFCCRIILVLFICNEVSAICTDYQVQEALKSSKQPWDNYFKISRAVYPSVDMSARLIKIWVNFVNESSDVVCKEEGDSIYTWSMSCLYVSGGKISMGSMNVFSVGTIAPNRRETRLCIKLPKSCRCYLEKDGNEKMLYFLSTLQDIAIRPEDPDPSVNTEECITPGHGKTPTLPKIKKPLDYVCWCILVVGTVLSLTASSLLDVTLKKYCIDSDAKKNSKAAAFISLLLIVFIWGLASIVLTLIYDVKSTEFPWYEAYAFHFLLTVFGIFLFRLIWCLCHNRELKCGLDGWDKDTSNNFYSCTIEYPAVFMAFHNLLWMVLGVITEPFWAFPVFVSVVAVVFVFYFLLYQLFYAFENVREQKPAIVVTTLSFLFFVMLILIILLVGQSFFAEGVVTTIVMNVLVSITTFSFHFFCKRPPRKTSENTEPERQGLMNPSYEGNNAL